MVATIEKCESEIFALFSQRCRSYVVSLKHYLHYLTYTFLGLIFKLCGDVLKSLDIRELAEEGWIFAIAFLLSCIKICSAV